ncbi:Imidazolonepropionase [Sporomusa rhizae]|uniref:imidazolonepropionase n=1 Tax=Sporomusa rhizae TaxID=357999 RepID=UPI003529D4AD
MTPAGFEQASNAKILIKHASELVTCAGQAPKKGASMNDLNIIPDGALLAENGIITWAGATAELPAIDETQYTVIDAGGRCVLPGFVDSHTHFVFGGYRPEEFFWRLNGTPYLEILSRGGGILSTVQATRAAAAAELKQSAAKRLAEMLSMGVTTVEGKSGYGLDCDTELRQLSVMGELNQEQPVEIVPTFLGAHAVPPDYKGKTDEYVEYIINQVLPAVTKQGIAEFCDVFCEQGVFSIDQSRKLLQAAQNLGMKAKLHADEIVALGGAELAGELKAVSADHLLQATDAGIAALAENGVVATVLPATAFCLRESYARARTMIDSGVPVALATDFNPGSCFTQSIPMVIALAAIQLKMTAAEIVTALTCNGAAAVGRQDKIGSLERGKQADIIILDYPSHLFLVYNAGMNIVDKVIKKGQVVFSKSK